MGLLAVARSITALGREHFLPPVAAWVHHKTQTPIITTAVLGVVTGDDSSAALLLTLSVALSSICCSGACAHIWTHCLPPAMEPLLPRLRLHATSTLTAYDFVHCSLDRPIYCIR